MTAQHSGIKVHKNTRVRAAALAATAITAFTGSIFGVAQSMDNSDKTPHSSAFVADEVKSMGQVQDLEDSKTIIDGERVTGSKSERGEGVKETRSDPVDIPFTERTVFDSSLPEGAKVVISEGVDGRSELVTTTQETESGEVKKTRRIVTTPPQEKVTRVGTNKASTISSMTDKIKAQETARQEAERKAEEEKLNQAKQARQEAAKRAAARAQAIAGDKLSTDGAVAGDADLDLSNIDTSASGTTTPEENRAFLASIVSGEELKCADIVIMRESGYRTDATNPSSGAYGVAQSLPAGKYASHGSDWRTNGKTQILWMKDYVDQRYGGFCGARDWHYSHNWY